MYQGPGIYRHYKGGHYRALGIAEHETTGERFVIYHSYNIERDLDRSADGVDYIARPLDHNDGPDPWNQTVIIRGAKGDDPPISRFQRIR